MTRHSTVLQLVTLAVFSGSLHAQTTTVPDISGVPAAARQAAASVDPEKIRAHVAFLADDLLEGRGPGQRGAELAAKYIATQFALDGLKPAGENGSYFQRVPLYAVHTVEDQTSFCLSAQDRSGHFARVRRERCNQR